MRATWKSSRNIYFYMFSTPRRLRLTPCTFKWLLWWWNSSEREKPLIVSSRKENRCRERERTFRTLRWSRLPTQQMFQGLFRPRQERAPRHRRMSEVKCEITSNYVYRVIDFPSSRVCWKEKIINFGLFFFSRLARPTQNNRIGFVHAVLLLIQFHIMTHLI